MPETGDRVVPSSVPGWDETELHRFAGILPIFVGVYRRLGPDDFRLAEGALRTPGGSLRVTANAASGSVDSVNDAGHVVTVTGWAADQGHRPVDHLVALAGNRAVAAGLPMLSVLTSAAPWARRRTGSGSTWSSNGLSYSPGRPFGCSP